MMGFFELPEWINWWLSVCAPVPADVADYLPPRDEIPVRIWLVPLLCFVLASGAIGLAIVSWVRKTQRKVTYFALGTSAVCIGIFGALFALGFFEYLDQGASDTQFSFDTPTVNPRYYIFLGYSIGSCAIYGALLGLSALVLRVLQSRIGQGAMLCLTLLQSLSLTAAWGAFSYAATCGP